MSPIKKALLSINSSLSVFFNTYLVFVYKIKSPDRMFKNKPVFRITGKACEMLKPKG